MTGYLLLRRIVLVIPVLVGVSIAAFMMSHLVPGDPVAVMLGSEGRPRTGTDCGKNLG